MENNFFENRMDLSDLSGVVENIKKEIGKTIVGQQKMVEYLIAALLADGHVLIEGVPGVAKTLTAKLMAQTISAGYSRIQFTPDLMPSDVIGTSVFNPKNSEFTFKKGPVFSNIILIDEINRAPAKTQAALFEVMEERQITIDGILYPMQLPFMVLATQNPIEHEGTYRLPEAQLDRFLFKIVVDYPQPDEEVAILSGFHERKENRNLIRSNAVISVEQIEKYRQQVKAVHIDEKLIRYITQIILHTRNHNSLMLGASPRASIAILSAAKAISVIRGKDFVTPAEIQEVAYPVLQHRIILTPEKEMEGVKEHDVIREIIEKIEVPR